MPVAPHGRMKRKEEKEEKKKENSPSL